jgi:hypothetical protein
MSGTNNALFLVIYSLKVQREKQSRPQSNQGFFSPNLVWQRAGWTAANLGAPRVYENSGFLCTNQKNKRQLGQAGPAGTGCARHAKAQPT